MNRSTLPTHPHLVHPHTGAPLQAVMIGKRGPVWPILGGDPSEDPPADDLSGGDPAGDPADDPAGYPANTRLADMTVEQREAYWKAYARRNEDLLKDLGITTATDRSKVKERLALADRLEHETLTEHERAMAEAVSAARAEERLANAPVLVEAAFARYSAGRQNAAGEDLDIEAIVEGLDPAKYLTADGKPDAAKVKAYLDRIAPIPAKPAGPPARGMGMRDGGGSGAGTSAGSDLYRTLHPKAQVTSQS